MDIAKQLSRLTGEIRDLLGKLTVSQRITIGLLTILIAGGIMLAVMLSRGEPYVTLHARGDAKSVSELKSLLEENGIPYRMSGTGDGAGIQVPRDSLRHARWLASENGSAKDSSMEWLFGEGSFLDTESRFDQRLHESRTRVVEDAMRWSRSIRDVSLVVQRGPEPIYISKAASADSAAVTVALRPGVEALSRTEASTIRTMVAGAFRIPPQNIQVTDDRLRNYPYVESAGGQLTDEDDRTKKVQTTVESLLGRIYRPVEFVVGVLVDVSARRSQLTKESYDPEKVVTAERSNRRETESGNRSPGSTVGVEPNVAAGGGLGGPVPATATDTHTRELKEVAFENKFTKSEERTEVPAGEIKGLSVNVVLDQAAVRRVLQAREFTRLTADRKTSEKVEAEADIVNFTVDGKLGTNNLDAAIDSYLKAETEFLKDQIPMSGAKVNVSARPFPRLEGLAQLAATGRALGWFAEHWSDLLVGAFAVVGLWVVYRMFMRTVPPPLDVPALDEAAIADAEQAGNEEIRKLEQEIAAVKWGSGAANEKRDSAANEMVESVSSVNTITKQNPEMASAVVRLWLADKEAKEE